MTGRALLLSLMLAGAARADGAEPAPVATFSALYTADIWSNMVGGRRRGSVYLDNIDLVGTYDAERGIGLGGVRMLVSLLYNNRQRFSDPFVGDLQTVSNIDTRGTLRPYEAWVEEDFGAGAVKLGLIDFNSEFDVNETGGLFINSSQGIGPDLSQVGANGPGIFPVTALGGRLSLRSKAVEFKLGLFEGIPGDPDDPRHIRIQIQHGEGALLTGELDIRPNDALRLAAGLWRHTGSPLVELRPAYGGYAIVEGRLFTTGRGAFSAFGRIGSAHGRDYQLGGYEGGGIAYAGPILADREEQVGLAVGSARNARSYRVAEARAGSPVERRETVFELTYRSRLAPWLALQPDAQYIIDPGTNPTLGDALAIGLRFEIGWGTAGP